MEFIEMGFAKTNLQYKSETPSRQSRDSDSDQADQANYTEPTVTASSESWCYTLVSLRYP